MEGVTTVLQHLSAYPTEKNEGSVRKRITMPHPLLKTAGEIRVLCHTCGQMCANMIHTHVCMNLTQHTHETDTCKDTLCG